MSQRVKFCGVIEGSVVRRAGESDREAIARAEERVNRVLYVHCQPLSLEDVPGFGPIVGLEPAE